MKTKRQGVEIPGYCDSIKCDVSHANGGRKKH